MQSGGALNKESVNVLITGGLGFIGRNTARHFVQRGSRVVLMDNLSAQIHGAVPSFGDPFFASTHVHCLRGDVRERRDWGKALEGIDHVVHLAAETGTAQSMYEIDQYSRVNISGTAILLDILANSSHHIKRVVLASSRSVYGEGAYDCESCGCVFPLARTREQLERGRWDPVCPRCSGLVMASPTPENANLSPASIYAATKLAQEHLVQIAGAGLGISTTILRFQNVYGEGQSLKNPYTGILSIFSNKLKQSCSICLYEDGLESRDFVHVDDVAAAIVMATFDGGRQDIFNVGSGKAFSIGEIASMLKSEFNDETDTEISGEYRLGDIRHSIADISAIRRSLGFEPKVDMRSGLHRFAEWVKGQPNEADGLPGAAQLLLDRGLMGRLK
jgi:dTDP-L-rhamnose 4-epimerase